MDPKSFILFTKTYTVPSGQISLGQDRFEQVKQRMDTRTVVLTIFPTWLPLASTILFKFWSAWRVCASTPPSANVPVLGSKPRHPETNTKGGLTMA
jgi:hypothetical protein